MNESFNNILKRCFNDWELKMPMELQEQVFTFLKQSMIFGDINEEAKVLRDEVASNNNSWSSLHINGIRYSGEINKGIDRINVVASPDDGINTAYVIIKNGTHNIEIYKHINRNEIHVSGHSYNRGISDKNVDFDGVYSDQTGIQIEVCIQKVSGRLEKVTVGEPFKVTSYEELGNIIREHVNAEEIVQSR